MFGLAEAKAFIVLRHAKKGKASDFLRGPTLSARGTSARAFNYCIVFTLIAAVNECPLQLSVAGRSMQHRQAPAR
jgi:hypothetical protein